jgi:hypothetical protein
MTHFLNDKGDLQILSQELKDKLIEEYFLNSNTSKYIILGYEKIFLSNLEIEN